MKIRTNLKNIFVEEESVPISSFTSYSANLKKHRNIIDLLRTVPSHLSFIERVHKIGLSRDLVDKVIQADSFNSSTIRSSKHYLSEQDEKELAAEVLITRHKFTCLVSENRIFRQAVLTIIQNIYLFRQRKIFFGTSDISSELERQEALRLFSQYPGKISIPLTKTFQHFILARVWDRIIGQASNTFLKSQSFNTLHDVVTQLNTLRNIYMLLSIGLTHKLTQNVNQIYRQSITTEDARQIGSFGIARAAYRYHPSLGIRFSTYASHWILKEIQRQALEGRLIRISSNLVENISRESKNSKQAENGKSYEKLCRATARLDYCHDSSHRNHRDSLSANPNELLEKKEMQSVVIEAIDQVLSPKSSDVIKRRYGLGSYQGRPQSVVEIGKAYGVTRGSIYQLEKTALKKLKISITKLYTL